MITKKRNLLSDEPVRHTDRKEVLREEALNFDKAAGVLADAAMDTKDPITIGVCGKWGVGKTSMLRLMEKCVSDRSSDKQVDPVVPVWFNAWKYEQESHLIIPLIATIVSEIEKIENQSLKDASTVLRSVLFGLSMQGNVSLPFFGGIQVKADMKDMIKRYEALKDDVFAAQSIYFRAFNKLDALQKEELNIVVFIDDLDRCFPERAVELLEGIKLILHQPGFSFVLGIYPDIIESFVRNKYASGYAFKTEQSSGVNRYLEYFSDYLDKIIQVRYDVPEREPVGMHEYIKNLLSEVSMESVFFENASEEKDIMELIAEACDRNPRKIVRAINSQVVKHRISEAESSGGATYNPVSGIINMLVSEKIRSGMGKYQRFIHFIDQEYETRTYGSRFSELLETNKSKKLHEEIVGGMKESMTDADDETMKTLIDIPDERFLVILGTKAGQKWLSESSFRKEMVAEQDKEQGTSEADLWGLLNMVPVAGGTFERGEKSDGSIHAVELSKFQMMSAPVTQGLYLRIMKDNPSHFSGDNHPVETVSWHDAMSFCEELTRVFKKQYRFRLPTEAEWEYAARGGKESKGYVYAGSNNLDEVAWHGGNSGDKTHPVGEKKANELGLYDMSGNVWEWCSDWYGENYYQECKEKGITIDPQGPDSGENRVYRGGFWLLTAGYCRSAFRTDAPPAARDLSTGFRVVCVP